MDLISKILDSDGPLAELVADRLRGGQSSPHVKVHPKDFSVPDFVFQDPERFEPVLNNGWLCKNRHCWGVYELDAEPTRIMKRHSVTQFMYDGRDPGYDKVPEVQFVELLMKRKLRLMRQNLRNVEHLFRQDMILDIELEDIKPRTWRRFQVSGGITLTTLHDKVLVPLMGFVRNYHTWQMYDHSDGATWGAADSSAVDMMHMPLNGYKTLPGEATKLAEMLQIPGTTMGYMYDMGDHWSHIITLVGILPAEESTGRCLVLDGAMACPPEDSNGLGDMGLQPYQKFLTKVLKAKRGTSHRDKRKYRDLCASASGLNYKDKVYDPHDFSVEDAQEAVKAAFRSKASVPQGSKVFSTPLQPGAQALLESSYPPNTSTRIQRDDPRDRSFMSEAVATRRDRKSDTGCAECGRPNELKLCSGCRQNACLVSTPVNVFRVHS
ncbi:hypothetical protein WJX73_008847 [Symbiochloris irregularis]|uniref:Plasmid pRiA4b Orf3-like domain-containing protein n=1 Tax=Symbiochloris irregularis TaxID=706552 RepID=A0AAW1PZL0_9CHLO